jgi:EAL domain-containing protein (putative c-di-GMP-specific phosphodiesterase class I)
MSQQMGETPGSSYSPGARAVSLLLARFESLSGPAGGAVILAVFAVTLVFPRFGSLEALLALWLLVPVILAAIRFRSLGALIAAGLALLLVGPLVPWRPGPLGPGDVFDWIAAALAFVALGQFVAVAVHQPVGTRLDVLRSIRAERVLGRALAEDQLAVHYQPIVAIGGHPHIVSAEALLRWRDPAAHTVPATELVTAAEHSVIMRELSQFVLHETCDHIAEWSALFGRQFVISVNLSASELGDDALPTRIRAAITQSHIDPRQLGLEITETVAMADIRHSITLLQQIHDLGVRLSIDDFGTGQSSLEYIKLLPVDIIKIDGSFVEALGDDPIPSKLVSIVIDLAHTMGLRTVAEHVETDQQLSVLRAMGCDYAQGFLFSRALAPHLVTEWLHERSPSQAESRHPPRTVPGPRPRVGMHRIHSRRRAELRTGRRVA